MKVILLSPLPPPSGGIARWTQLYLSECERNGIKADVINTNISSKRASQKTRSFSIFDEIARSKRIISGLKERIKTGNPDVIHICSSCSRFGLFRDLFCVLAAKETHVFFHSHCNIEDQATTKISKYVLGIIVRKSKKVFVLNETSKKFIDEIEPRKAVLVPNFIEDECLRENHKISDHIKTVVFVGHVKIKKGIIEIFKVASSLKDIKFIVIGPVQQLPNDIEKPDNVILEGEVEHEKLSSYWQNADLFFFPSYTEGFANVMLEAMANGLPIVATKVGANKDMIENHGGTIVPVGDIEAMKTAILEMDDPELRKKMSIWNIKKVRNKYALSKVMPCIKQCYEEE
jgi:glycosyltransferase involved in cell wall biosynthesis